MDVEDDPGRVAEEEDEDDAEQDQAQVHLPPLPPRRPEPLHLQLILIQIIHFLIFTLLVFLLPWSSRGL